MTDHHGELLSRYFDDLLTADEHRELQDWLKSAPENIQQFTQAALLHDRLRSEQQAISLTQSPARHITPAVSSPPRRKWRLFGISAGVLAACTVLFILFLETAKTTASAASELKRLIVVQEASPDQTYRISVEESVVPRRQRPHSNEAGRPPKPPLDGAVLHVRHGGQFVLIRYLPGGQQFVTGSNGTTSWAVRPDGPVRVSTDLTRFSRDLPGHEHDLPLLRIEQGLERLRAAYHIELLPIETEYDSDEGIPTRLLVGVKKRGFRGPQRIEITYAVSTGQIRQLRFIEMPYGPEHLTVRLTLLEEQSVSAEFFNHQSHHTPDRIVEEE